MQLFITPGAIPVTDGKNAQIPGAKTPRPDATNFETVLQALAGQGGQGRGRLPEFADDSSKNAQLDPQTTSDEQGADLSFPDETAKAEPAEEGGEIQAWDDTEGDDLLTLAMPLPAGSTGAPPVGNKEPVVNKETADFSIAPQADKPTVSQIQTASPAMIAPQTAAVTASIAPTVPYVRVAVAQPLPDAIPQGSLGAEQAVTKTAQPVPSSAVATGLPDKLLPRDAEDQPRFSPPSNAQRPTWDRKAVVSAPLTIPSLQNGTGRASSYIPASAPMGLAGAVTPEAGNPVVVQAAPPALVSPSQTQTPDIAVPAPQPVAAPVSDSPTSLAALSALAPDGAQQAPAAPETAYSAQPEGQPDIPQPKSPEASHTPAGPLVAAPLTPLPPEGTATEIEPMALDGLAAQDGLSPQNTTGSSRGAALPPVAKQILHQLTETPLQQGDKLEITLSPDELGRVRLTARHTDQGLVLLVQAERPETLDLMRRHMPDLMQDLQDMGFGDVNYSGGRTPNRDQGRPETSNAAPEPAAPTQPQAYASGTGLDLRL